MTELLITSDGNRWDIALDDGEGQKVEDLGPLVEVIQRVVYRLMTWYGESVYATEDGMPYEQGIFGEDDVEGISALFYLEVLRTEGVDEITHWDPKLENRVFKLAFSIRVGAQVSDVVYLEITPP